MLCWRAGLLVRIGGVDAAGVQGTLCDTVARRPAHEPLRVAPHYRACERAPLPVPGVRPRVAPRYEPSGPAARQALAGGGALGAHWASRSSCDGGAHPQALGVSQNTDHTAVLGEGQRLLINDPTRFDGVRVIGVDEHVWRHISYGDKNRHRYLGRDAHPRSQRPLPALGHGPRPLQAGLQNLAGLPARHVA